MPVIHALCQKKQQNIKKYYFRYFFLDKKPIMVYNVL